MLRFLMICEVLCISGMLQGCDVEATSLEATEVRDIGLPASGTPPSGEAIAPIAGRGGDGSPVVVAVGGWSTGPGAVKWHGGQWLIPYVAQPGSVLANAWCDVMPRADANALVELVSSNGQVLGSNTVPATTANVVVRLWPFVGTHTVSDGEQVVMRISPKDSTTGAWTSAAQDMTVVGCAVNAILPAANSVTLSAGNNPNPIACDRINLITSSGFPFINGISGGKDGRSVTLVLATMSTSAGQVTLSRLDGSSASDEQLLLPFFGGEPELTMDRQDEAVTFTYDASVHKWRMVAKNF